MTNEEVKKIEEISNNALYFNDNSDYETALWEILTIVSPDKFVNDSCPELDFIE